MLDPTAVNTQAVELSYICIVPCILLFVGLPESKEDTGLCTA